MNNKLITIWGKAGSGKWTVTRLLSEHLGYDIISIGDMKRKLAHEMGLSISQFNEMGEQSEHIAEFDLKYEDYQKSLGLEEKIILDSRLGFFCQPDATKIFLDVDPMESARRIFSAYRKTDSYESVQQVFDINQKRDAEDSKRYLALYGVDHLDISQYDIIVDTTHINPQQVMTSILAKLSKPIQ